MMDRFICIHAHFYQPPRENPWLEAVELQDSAFPYHDWNERVTAECYAPNSASRIVDGDRRIMDIVSNYAKISFNFGPTVLMWMEQASPELHRAIVEADRQSLTWRSGHGAAIAQVYNHMIMPLATTRDKRTQIVWGIRDFEYRFGRSPEGMWLAETAVDLETLDLLAEQRIKFTILAPSQAARFRAVGADEWTDLQEADIDPTRSYLCRLPSGRTIALFFYDGPISQAVAFESLLNSGEGFAHRLLDGFSDTRNWPQLLHIATDGESYGHHHRFGDMALAAALNYVESNHLAQLTNYGEYLERHPPIHEAAIHENTSWSCFHGVERWRSNCGCNSGGRAEWNQEWRAPLRAALDWLRDRLAEGFDKTGKKYFKDPWRARDEYIEVILDRTEDNRNRFFLAHAGRELTDEERITALKLLEIQRHAMLMYTSCGWFFDELSGIETVQVIEYAGRTLQLAHGLLEAGLEQGFLERLGKARSNIPEHKDGAEIYRKFVLPAQVDLIKVAVHFAFSSLFHDYEENTRIFSYTVALEDYDKRVAEEVTIATGRLRIVSEITLESERLMFCVVRFGRHDFKGGVSRCADDAACAAMMEELNTVFEKGLFTDIIALMDTFFGSHSYCIGNLFIDEQRAILDHIITATMDKFKQDYRSMYEHSRFLMEFVEEIGMPVPKAFLAAAALTLNEQIKEALVEDEVDPDKVHRIVTHMKRWNLEVNPPDTEIVIRRHMERLMNGFSGDPADMVLLDRINTMMTVMRSIPLEIDLWDIQNVYFRMAKTIYDSHAAAARRGDEAAGRWVASFRQLGERLHVNLGAVLPENPTEAAATNRPA